MVGGEQERMLVHSGIMKTASPVFRAMLGPHFAEGQRLREAGNNPIEISLPEDDEAAFRLICAILCLGEHELKTAEVSAPALYSAAILVDKYDMKDRLFVTIPFLLNNLRDSINTKSSSSQMWHAGLAAYILEDSKSFCTFTKMMVESGDSYLPFVGEIGDEILGFRLCCEYEKVSLGSGN